MSHTYERLQDLKEHAESTLFADWHVTPELKAKLGRRIRQAEARNAQARNTQARSGGAWFGPGSRPVAVMAVSVAAFLVVGTFGLALAPDEGVIEQAAAAGTTGVAAGGLAVLPPPIQYTSAPAAANDDAIPLGFPQVAKVNLTLTQKDQYGNAVTVGAPGAGLGMGSPGAGLPGVEVHPGQKIVLNADFQLETADAEAAMTQLQRLAFEAQGYVVESTLTKGSDSSYAGRMVMRIPSDRYAGVVLQMGSLGSVNQQRQWSQDVTDRYQDLTVRIGLLQEMEQKLEALALKAESFDDWLKLTHQINENRAALESLQGSLKQLANQVEYSTITVSLRQPPPDAVRPVPGTEPPGLGTAMTEAFGATVRKAGSLGRRSLIGLAAGAPFLLPVGLLALLTIALWRRRSRTVNAGGPATGTTPVESGRDEGRTCRGIGSG